MSNFDESDNGNIKKVRGEISPHYARLGISRVKSIAKLIPDLKIILLIRHPLKRAWSGICYEMGGIYKKDLSRISEIEYLLHLSRHRSKYYNFYYRTITIWKEAFGEEAILVCFQEDILADPKGNIKRILSHIGASTNYVPTDEVMSINVNTTTKKINQEFIDIPKLIEWAIAKQTFPDLIKLNSLFEEPVYSWAQELEEIEKNAKLDWKIKYYLINYLLSIPEIIIWSILEFIRDIVLELKVANWLAKNERNDRP
ncbi:MAG: sulfotransferase [Microcoleaceae cyanobacterium]